MGDDTLAFVPDADRERSSRGAAGEEERLLELLARALAAYMAIGFQRTNALFFATLPLLHCGSGRSKASPFGLDGGTKETRGPEET